MYEEEIILIQKQLMHNPRDQLSRNLTTIFTFVNQDRIHNSLRMLLLINIIHEYNYRENFLITLDCNTAIVLVVVNMFFFSKIYRIFLTNAVSRRNER